jgi:predicted RNA-binding protein YlqC (UPF0109 family)
MNSPPLSGGKRKLGEIDLLEAARASARALVSKFEPAKQAASAYASYASTFGSSFPAPAAYGYAAPGAGSTAAWTAAAAAAGPQVVQSYTRERVGRIIGPGGSNITVIRKESGAKIKIDSNCVAGHQQVTYSGTDAEIQAAIALVDRLLATADPGQSETPDGAPRTEHKQELDKESAGKVIGQGGATIKSIRESSGAYIKISNEKIPGVDTQTLTIGGTEEQARGGPVSRFLFLFLSACRGNIRSIRLMHCIGAALMICLRAGRLLGCRMGGAAVGARTAADG